MCLLNQCFSNFIEFEKFTYNFICNNYRIRILCCITLDKTEAHHKKDIFQII